MNFTVLRFDSIDSTNSEAFRQARLGVDEGLCVVARQQTAGRGRLGRTWNSPEDAGLYLSIVLRPNIDTKLLPLVTLMTGIAVHDTLAGLGLAPDIKWPNDVLIGDKKICGILAETTESPDGQAVVVGIGINLTRSSYPADLAADATSTEDEGKTVKAADLERLLLEQFATWYETLIGEADASKLLGEWRRRSTYFNGKPVRVTTGNETIEGVTDGLEPTGALCVKKLDGTIAVVQAGDVERLRPAA